MKVIYGIIILLLVNSCAKDNNSILELSEDGKTVVEGKVTEKGSGNAIANTMVKLRSLPHGASVAIYRTDTIVYADDNGNYAFFFDADKN